MSQQPFQDSNAPLRWLFWCGVVITALCFFLFSSVFGAIAVPNHTELERTLTPSPPAPTPIPTAIPQPAPDASQSATGGVDFVLLGWLAFVLTAAGIALFAVIAAHQVRRTAPTLAPPAPPMLTVKSVAHQPITAQQLEAFSCAMRDDALIAGKQAAREMFWQSAYRQTKAAAQGVEREAELVTGQSKAREPAVVRNSRRLHAQPKSDETVRHAGRRNGAAQHKGAGPRL